MRLRTRVAYSADLSGLAKKLIFLKLLERAMRFELTTLTLAR